MLWELLGVKTRVRPTVLPRGAPDMFPASFLLVYSLPRFITLLFHLRKVIIL